MIFLIMRLFWIHLYVEKKQTAIDLYIVSVKQILIIFQLTIKFPIVNMVGVG